MVQSATELYGQSNIVVVQSCTELYIVVQSCTQLYSSRTEVVRSGKESYSCT